MKLDSFARCPAKYLGNIFVMVLLRGRYEPEPSIRDAALLSGIPMRDRGVLLSRLGLICHPFQSEAGCYCGGKEAHSPSVANELSAGWSCYFSGTEKEFHPKN